MNRYCERIVRLLEEQNAKLDTIIELMQPDNPVGLVVTRPAVPAASHSPEVKTMAKKQVKFVHEKPGMRGAKPAAAAAAGAKVSDSGPFPITVGPDGSFKVWAVDAQGNKIDVSVPGPNQATVTVVDATPNICTATVATPAPPNTADSFAETGVAAGAGIETITLTFVDSTIGPFTGPCDFTCTQTPTGFVVTPA